MSEKVVGKVAQILTIRELVINRGTDDGVRVGMRFAVLNRKGADIVDPDTGDNIGSVELPKTFVKVISVKEKVCVARTFREFKTQGTALWNLFSAPPSTQIETLKMEGRSAKEELDESESYVKIGDPVVQMTGDEYAGAAGE